MGTENTLSFNVDKSFPAPAFLVIDCLISLEVYNFMILLLSLIVIFIASYTNYYLVCSCLEFLKILYFHMNILTQ
jgi:hypothetical protein